MYSNGSLVLFPTAWFWPLFHLCPQKLCVLFVHKFGVLFVSPSVWTSYMKSPIFDNLSILWTSQNLINAHSLQKTEKCRLCEREERAHRKNVASCSIRWINFFASSLLFKFSPQFINTREKIMKFLSQKWLNAFCDKCSDQMSLNTNVSAFKNIEWMAQNLIYTAYRL